MQQFDVPSVRSIRRLNRRVHDPISAWLAAVLASLVRRERPGTVPADYPAERPDLYGFTASDSPPPKARADK